MHFHCASRQVLRTLALSAAFCLALSPVRAQESSNPVELRPSEKPIGEPIRVQVSEMQNPIYMTIHLSVGELKRVDSIVIMDKTARRELHRFSRSQFAAQIEGQSPETSVTFGKNLTFRRPDKRPDHEIFVATYNERNHPIRVSTFQLRVQPHESEVLAGEESYAIFVDIAKIEFEAACKPRSQRHGLRTGIFIGEEEQEFPSLAYLTKVQTRESLRGYYEGCVQAYNACLGRAPNPTESQRLEAFCSGERDRLRNEVFRKQD